MKLELDAGEAIRFQDWDKTHLRKAHNGKEPYGGTIGGRVSFVVTNTSIGQLLTVKCNACENESFLLTDVGSL